METTSFGKRVSAVGTNREFDLTDDDVQAYNWGDSLIVFADNLT